MKHQGIVLASILVLIGGGSASAEIGPGPHWVDTVPEGLYTAPSIATMGIDVDFDNVEDFFVFLDGPTEIWGGGAVDAIVGDPELGDIGTIDGHLDVVETEIVSLELEHEHEGEIPGLPNGLVLVNAGDDIANGLNDGPLNSPGALTELANDPSLAYSFFDVNLNIDFAGIQLHAAWPVRLHATIDGVPPILADYVHPLPEPVPILNEADEPVFQLVNATHTLMPEPSALALLCMGAAGLLACGWRRRKR